MLSGWVGGIVILVFVVIVIIGAAGPDAVEDQTKDADLSLVQHVKGGARDAGGGVFRAEHEQDRIDVGGRGW